MWTTKFGTYDFSSRAIPIYNSETNEEKMEAWKDLDGVKRGKCWFMAFYIPFLRDGGA